MFIDRMLNQGPTPLLEKMLDFTAARHQMLAENIVNIDTPNYHNKDLSLTKFQSLLRDRSRVRSDIAPGSVRFDDIHVDPHQTDGLMFHDGNNRSAEQLMTDEAKNALMHNLVVELLRKQYSEMEMALKDRVT